MEPDRFGFNAPMIRLENISKQNGKQIPFIEAANEPGVVLLASPTKTSEVSPIATHAMWLTGCVSAVSTNRASGRGSDAVSADDSPDGLRGLVADRPEAMRK